MSNLKSDHEPKTVDDTKYSMDTHLIYGHTWRITRSDAGSSPVPMQACIGPKQTFTKVVLSEDGLFNFERVNSILIEGETCHVATDCGLIQLNAARF